MSKNARPLVEHTIREGFLQARGRVGAPIEARRPPRAPDAAAPEAPAVAPAARAANQASRQPGPSARPAQAAAPRLAVASAQGLAGQGAAGRPMADFYSDRASGALEGSTIADAQARVSAAGGQQRNRALLRVVVPASASRPQPQIFELRVLVLANGRDVIRYTVYHDDGGGRSAASPTDGRVAGQVRQAQVLPATSERPAEIHLRYAGQLLLGDIVVDFDGMTLIGGQGNLRAVVPNVQGADAMAVVADGTVEIGWS